MKREQVTSKLLKSVGYDELTETLHAEFNNGKVYEYKGVPEKTFLNLMRAKSFGAFFLAEIKPVYSCREIEQRKPEEEATFD